MKSLERFDPPLPPVLRYGLIVADHTFRECCALHEWPECESRTAEIWGAMIGQYGPFATDWIF
jgi:hypothetical protein